MSGYTYLYKMNKLIYIGMLFLPVLLLATGCSQEEMRGRTNGTDVEEGGFVPVSFSIVPEPLQVIMDTETGGEHLLSTKAESEDATINNLTVLQFDWDKDTQGPIGDGAECVTSRYLRAPEPEEGTENVYSIGLRAQANDKKQYLVFIANAGSLFQQYEGRTLGDFRKETVALDQKTTSGDNILMIGAVDVTVSSEVNSVPHSLTLKRLVACVRFSWIAKPTVTNTTFTPSVLQLKNVPKILKYIDGVEPPAAIYPVKDAGNFKDYTPIVDRIDEGFTWYIPLNRRSDKGTATNIWEKTGENAPDDYCTYIELAGVYRTPNMPDQLATYRFYIGENLTNDYNVHQNYMYNVKAEITGVNTFDKRVNSKNFNYTSSANCFLIAPEKEQELSFSPYTAPGVDVDGSGVIYKDRFIEDRYSKISDVKLIWQTATDLVSVSHGQGMVNVKPNEAGTVGNALIGAYGEDGSILWSWHIWVTPYAKVVDGSGTAGKLHDYGGYIWMDRNLGALTTDIKDNKIRGLYYQWGRKDPFYDKSVMPIVSGGTGVSVEDKGTALNIDQSVAAPTVFFKNQSGTNCWHGGDPIPDLWLLSDKKSVFDPCPAGWRVPEKMGWDTFTWKGNFSWDTANATGANREIGGGVSAWYPASGGLDGGSMSFSGTYAYLWSASFDNTGAKPVVFRFNSSTAGTTQITSAWGAAVRCVKDK